VCGDAVPEEQPRSNDVADESDGVEGRSQHGSAYRARACGYRQGPSVWWPHQWRPRPRSPVSLSR
jgi:hypothetical protein